LGQLDGRTRREAATHERGMGETSFRGDLVFLGERREWNKASGFSNVLLVALSKFIRVSGSHVPHSKVCIASLVTISLTPCLDARLELKFFHSLSITSTFARMHEALNIDKKNN
jgi:hypothetical protein